MKKIGFVSLGCPKNLVDSEVMMGLVKQNGYQLTADQQEADVIVVNTCAFINPAKRESIDTILEMAELKKTGQCEKLVVTGCLVERYRDELLKEMPEIDAALGTNQIAGILQVISNGENRAVPTSQAMEYLYDHTTPRVLSTPRFTAYIKIAEGCDHTCAFCIIPKLRGRFRSRSLDSVVKEAEALSAQGIRELVLVSQDTTHYGEDLGVHDGLAKLLKRLSRVDGIEWVRFLYCYPNHVTDELLDAVAEEDRLCKYVDIPFQHASANVLHAMRRGGSRVFLEKLVERIRHRVPGVSLRTTFIVGFPGETEGDFDEMLDFVKTIGFDHVGVFPYSDEEGTQAYHHERKVPSGAALARQRRLMKEQARISKRKNQARVGQLVKVLVEGYSEESELLLQGRMESQAPEIDGCVLINEVPDDKPVQAGDFVTVEITEAFEHDLLGRVV
jgi:ribosomal protein S12 methylthiotransferase